MRDPGYAIRGIGCGLEIAYPASRISYPGSLLLLKAFIKAIHRFYGNCFKPSFIAVEPPCFFYIGAVFCIRRFYECNDKCIGLFVFPAHSTAYFPSPLYSFQFYHILYHLYITRGIFFYTEEDHVRGAFLKNFHTEQLRVAEWRSHGAFPGLPVFEGG